MQALFMREARHAHPSPESTFAIFFTPSPSFFIPVWWEAISHLGREREKELLHLFFFSAQKSFQTPASSAAAGITRYRNGLVYPEVQATGKCSSSSLLSLRSDVSRLTTLFLSLFSAPKRYLKVRGKGKIYDDDGSQIRELSRSLSLSLFLTSGKIESQLWKTFNEKRKEEERNPFAPRKSCSWI